MRRDRLVAYRPTSAPIAGGSDKRSAVASSHAVAPATPSGPASTAGIPASMVEAYHPQTAAGTSTASKVINPARKPAAESGSA